MSCKCVRARIGILVCGLAVLATGSHALAGTITYSGGVLDLNAMGFGHIPPILSVRPEGAETSEWGSVSWDGSTDVLTGDARSAGSQTMTVAQLLAEGVTKDLFGIVLNINEDSDRDVTIQAFSLDVYSDAGTPLFSVPFVGGPLTVPSAGRGQGQAGYLFVVNLNNTEWTTYFSGATSNRVGMTVPGDEEGGGQPILNVSDGAESFTAAPVPEPATLSLLVLGGLALIRRRRRR